MTLNYEVFLNNHNWNIFIVSKAKSKYLLKFYNTKFRKGNILKYKKQINNENKQSNEENGRIKSEFNPTVLSLCTLLTWKKLTYKEDVKSIFYRARWLVKSKNVYEENIDFKKIKNRLKGVFFQVDSGQHTKSKLSNLRNRETTMKSKAVLFSKKSRLA